VPHVVTLVTVSDATAPLVLTERVAVIVNERVRLQPGPASMARSLALRAVRSDSSHSPEA
jgi:hypothetical protein